VKKDKQAVNEALQAAFLKYPDAAAELKSRSRELNRPVNPINSNRALTLQKAVAVLSKMDKKWLGELKDKAACLRDVHDSNDHWRAGLPVVGIFEQFHADSAANIDIVLTALRIVEEGVLNKIHPFSRFEKRRLKLQRKMEFIPN
jgi:hypothetical protein